MTPEQIKEVRELTKDYQDLEVSLRTVGVSDEERTKQYHTLAKLNSRIQLVFNELIIEHYEQADRIEKAVNRLVDLSEKKDEKEQANQSSCN